MPARVRVQQAGEQAERLGFARQQLRGEPGQEQRFLAEAAAAGVVTAAIGPAVGERGVDRGEHAVQARAQFFRLRHAQRDAGLADLFLRAPEALPIAAGEVRNAPAMRFASRPSTACSISGARMPASIAGCAQANIRARRRSGIATASSAASIPSASRCRCSSAASPLRRRRAASISLRRATVSSQASGFDGRPRGHSASAAANASASASSAAARSPERAASRATSLP